jgi:hypothetical protein
MGKYLEGSGFVKNEVTFLYSHFHGGTETTMIILQDGRNRNKYHSSMIIKGSNLKIAV